MNKKILALALAIVFIATAFTACKKGPELTEINGNEYPLAQDDNGETIINEENQIAVLVTDRNNEVLTYEDGENQTHWVQINGPLLMEDKIQTKEYSLGIPEGWEGDEIGGRVIKKGTDSKCYIQVKKMATLTGEETLDTYLEQVDAQNTAIAETFDDLVTEPLAENLANAIDYYVKNIAITGTIITSGSPVTQTAMISSMPTPVINGKVPNTLGIS